MTAQATLPFVLLGLAICLVWAPSFRAGGLLIHPFAPVFAGAIAAGAAAGVINASAALALGFLCALAWASVHAKARSAMAVAQAATIGLSILFMLHVVPGFENPKLLDQVKTSDGSAPFTQYLNFDKGAAGLVLLAAYARRSRAASDALNLGRKLLGLVPAVVALVIGTALVVGFIRLDIKLPSYTLVFLASNLLLTCVAEESLFRGFLQEGLTNALSHTRSSVRSWLPVGISALLFGVAHAGGGIPYLLLACVAGIAYSLSYAYARRIEAPILTHFAVNAVQFVGFSYPYVTR